MASPWRRVRSSMLWRGRAQATALLLALVVEEPRERTEPEEEQGEGPTAVRARGREGRAVVRGECRGRIPRVRIAPIEARVLAGVGPRRTEGRGPKRPSRLR